MGAPPITITSPRGNGGKSQQQQSQQSTRPGTDHVTIMELAHLGGGGTNLTIQPARLTAWPSSGQPTGNAPPFTPEET